MKHKTLFRLLLKILGVYFMGMGICALANMALTLLMVLSLQGGGSQSWYYFGNVAAQLMQIGVGLYLFFGGKWIVDLAIPSNRPYCHECGYDLTGAVGSVCNECGTPFRAEPAATK